MILRAPTPNSPARPITAAGFLRAGIIRRPHHRRGLGQTPGCPISSLADDLNSWAQSVIAFPSSLAGSDPNTEAVAFATQQCQESAAGSPFGCPPMAGCDSIPSLAANAAASIIAAPRYQSIINYGAGAPPPTMPTTTQTPLAVTHRGVLASGGGVVPAVTPDRAGSAGTPMVPNALLPPGAVAMGYQPAPTPPPQNPAPASTTQTQGGGITPAATTSTGFSLPSLSSIPWWGWAIGGGALLLLLKK